jgi:hypothetical protein
MIPPGGQDHRHLNRQLAMVAFDLEPFYAEAAKEREKQRKQTQFQPGKTTVADLPQSKAREQAAAAVGAAGRTVGQAKTVAQHDDDHLHDSR